MRRNVHQAVGIIAALSLLLGLSLGQLQEKHRIIENRRGHSRHIQMHITPAGYEADFNRYRCDQLRDRVDEIRAKVEEERARLEDERLRLLEEEMERANQSMDRDQTHVILREEL